MAKSETRGPYKDLTELCRSGPIPAGFRVYRVAVGRSEQFIIAKGPKSAAAAVVKPSVVKDREIVAAAMAAMSTSTMTAGLDNGEQS